MPKPLQFLCSFHPTQLPFQWRGRLHAPVHTVQKRSGIGVGCLLADVRFLIGVKASLLETILWGGTKPTKCFSRLLAFPLKTEHTSGSDLRALWLDSGVGWGWGWGERRHWSQHNGAEKPGLLASYTVPPEKLAEGSKIICTTLPQSPL